MWKLLMCIVGVFLICTALLHLRQKQLAHRHAIHQLNVRLHNSQATLWNQQLDIAGMTAPHTLARQVRSGATATGVMPSVATP